MAAEHHPERFYKLRLAVALTYAVRSYIHLLGACINGKYAAEALQVKERRCRYCVRAAASPFPLKMIEIPASFSQQFNLTRGTLEAAL